MLRCAATHILLSLLPLPLHFQGLCIKELNSSVPNAKVPLSHLRPQLVNLISGALQVETDATNIQMLLAGLVFCVQDSTLGENADNLSQHTMACDKDSNILSSAASDTLSSLGVEGSSLVGSGGGGGTGSSDTLDNASPVPPVLPLHLSSPVNPQIPFISVESFPWFDADDSAHGLYVRAIYLVSHCLMSSWTKDVNVSLAGLELLSSLALLNFGAQESDECKCAVKWLCDYIVCQCSRPPQAHSKDLHSMIVAAFHCASIWLVAHPYLLQDEECLCTVLEVIELGISGTKSQGKNGEAPKFKHEKELKPVSMRVRDAAEALLSCVLSQVGSFPSSCGVESLSSLLDEVSLLQHCNSYGGAYDPLTKDTAIQHFRYFVTQNSILLGLLEQPLVNHEDPQPTVTALIRGPFGRFAWTMQLRHLPRHKSSAKQHVTNPGRPLPMNDVGVKCDIAHKYFPESVDRIPMCKADKSIPSLEQVISSDEKMASEHEKMLQILDHQIAFEEIAKRQIESQKTKYPDIEVECLPPPLCQEFQTARLLLSHFGLLSLEALQPSRQTPHLVTLDTSQAGFTKDLDCLDNTNNRTVDTIHIFYVKAGQANAEDILSNVGPDGEIDEHFLEFLAGLGWTVNVHKHPGWTGHISTSFVSSQPPFDEEEIDEGRNGAFYSGRTHILYWADALSELAFIIPSLTPPTASSSGSQGATSSEGMSSGMHLHPGSMCLESASGGGSIAGSERSDSLPPLEIEPEGSSLSSHTSQVSGGGGSDSKSRRFGRQPSTQVLPNHRMFVVWLESLDDAQVFPRNDFLSITSTGLESPNMKEKSIPIYVIFIHPLANGLFRVNLDGQLTKLNLAGPLVDGQVISRRVLGALVRQTALNMCKRRRLESDSYQPPHVRRKFKIQEMVQKYKCEMNESEFYTHLFSTPLS
ncbi:Ral GTPase-activating protein subunit beta [Armadillidium nasatum]|uniref:Ral GTPase-activating protein subunit beta n=1 Tax=Armadillidium nasatum TaxID=96803 RepID=A0A5N5SMR3_9CRUS|nr:Ral GTPase-activating protein subunit beta [Armadillidium nasatum]